MIVYLDSKKKMSHKNTRKIQLILEKFEFCLLMQFTQIYFFYFSHLCKMILENPNIFSKELKSTLEGRLFIILIKTRWLFFKRPLKYSFNSLCLNLSLRFP